MQKYIVVVFILFMQIALISHAQKQFRITSDDFLEGKSIRMDQLANGFGCKGNNISPQISWVNPPPNTLSYAVTLYDPDAPTGSGWWHWVMFNIPATTTAIAKNAGVNRNNPLPMGVIQSRNDTGNTGFFGACPPEHEKMHHYQLNVYALDVESLPLTSDSMPAMVGFYIHAHTLAKANIEVTYQR
jgi:Raf kinase inhibitor-like YbhB/YbcL family protein